MPLALCLHLQEGDERAHLFLHRVEPDERVELGLELGQRPRRLRAPQRVELVGDPVRRIAAAGRLGEPLADDPQSAGYVFEGIPRH